VGKMVRFVHLFILSVLMVWLSVAGCIGNNASKTEDSGIHSKAIETGESAGDTLKEPELTEAEVQGLEADTSEIENLLGNSSIQEEIIIEEF
jgi:hypothetical protein